MHSCYHTRPQILKRQCRPCDRLHKSPAPALPPCRAVTPCIDGGSLKDLSYVLLLHNNLQRRAGWSLVPEPQMLAADAHVGQAACAVALLEPPAPQQEKQAVLYSNASCNELLGELQRLSATRGSECVVSRGPGAPADMSSSSSSSSGSSGSSQGQAASQSSSSQGPWQLRLPPAILQPLVEPLQSHQVLQGVAWELGSGNTVILEQLLLCPVSAPNDDLVGYALLVDAWRFSDGALGRPGWPHVQPGQIPDAAALQAAADAVRAQADAVRALKQEQGLSNKDPRVQAAVASLQDLKSELARLEGLEAAFRPGTPGFLEGLMVKR